MSVIEDLIVEIRDLSDELLMKGEMVTRDSHLHHRLVDLKRDLMDLADFLEQQRQKNHQSG